MIEALGQSLYVSILNTGMIQEIILKNYISYSDLRIHREYFKEMDTTALFMLKMLTHYIDNGLLVKILVISFTDIKNCTDREIAVVAHFICSLIMLIRCQLIVFKKT